MKRHLKTIANAVALLLVLPAVVFYQTARLVFGAERAFPGWSQAFSLIPGLSGMYLRRAFYRMVLPYCGEGVSLSFGSVLSHATARLGRSAYVGPFCALGDVTLEDDVLIGSYVSVMNGGSQHRMDSLDIPVRDQAGAVPHICIGRDSWIGDRAVIMADVGRHCVIGAGSIVTRPIPDYAIAVGSPAKVIRYRNRESIQSKDVSFEIPDLVESNPPAPK